MGSLFAKEDVKKDGIEGELQVQFSRIRVNWKDLQLAQTTMENRSMDKWDENVVQNTMKGLEEKNLDMYIELLSESLQLEGEKDKKLRADLKTIKITQSTGSRVQELTYDLGEGKSVYGFVVAMKDPVDNKISVAYAFHKLDFKMSASEKNLTAGEIRAIKTSYAQNAALTALKTDGLIKTINYE